MADYSGGYEFEEVVFGGHSHKDLFERFRGEIRDFDQDITDLILASKSECPPTRIGTSLYRQVKARLNSSGINPEGLLFLPSVNTKTDLLHYTDGLFFLPSLFPYLVTLDVFHIYTRSLLSLREEWIDSFAGDFYSNADFQSDLFLFKTGMAKWHRENKEALEQEISGGPHVTRPKDFRLFADRGRPENHFILTPSYVGSLNKRKEFAKLVADYFVKVSGLKMASQSP